jgi:transposase
MNETIMDKEPESAASGIPDPEVVERPKRRRFSAKYKLKILQETDERMARGESIGELLRREGLYYSILSKWRQERDHGQLNALAPKKRGRKPSEESKLVKENEKLQRELDRANKKLKQAEFIIEFQKKIAQIFEAQSEEENGKKK